MVQLILVSVVAEDLGLTLCYNLQKQMGFHSVIFQKSEAVYKLYAFDKIERVWEWKKLFIFISIIINLTEMTAYGQWCSCWWMAEYFNCILKCFYKYMW
mgnify:CR=1 FL=1